jgi:NAD(P)-dependent dehydrogenase (short-subunit alcohol dehydrogenase family)
VGALENRKGDRGLALVTGAGSGIGEVTALHLNELGYSVVAGVFSDADVECVRGKARAANRMHPIPFDITKPDEVDEARARVSELAEGRDGLRALFSNAGIAAFDGDTSCEGAPIEKQQRLMEVNHFGAVRVIQVFLPMLRAARGTIVVNTAMMAHVMLPFNGGYGASKCALDGWTDSLRREVAPLGVRVATIHAGAIATGLTSHGHEESAPVATGTLYPAQLGMAKHFQEDLEKAKDDPRCSPKRVAEIVAKAIEARHPKPRYIVGGGSRFLLLLGCLPQRLQDRVFARMLGRLARRVG